MMNGQRVEEEYVLDFGKYKGQTLKDVPTAYVVWLAGFYLSKDGKKEESTLDATAWVKTMKGEARARAEEFLEGKCWECGEKLVPIGQLRANGRAHADWSGRILHKKCWMERQRAKDSN